jgi:hypothetical protein
MHVIHDQQQRNEKNQLPGGIHTGMVYSHPGLPDGLFSNQKSQFG